MKELLEASQRLGGQRGKVIGRQGQIVDSIRTILAAAGMKLRKHSCVRAWFGQGGDTKKL